MQHLVDLLDIESTGQSVLWMDPDDRKKATEARLAQFQALSSLDAPPVIPSEDPAEDLKWPLLQIDDNRIRPAKNPFHDDFALDTKRLRRS